MSNSSGLRFYLISHMELHNLQRKVPILGERKKPYPSRVCWNGRKSNCCERSWTLVDTECLCLAHVCSLMSSRFLCLLCDVASSLSLQWAGHVEARTDWRRDPLFCSLSVECMCSRSCQNLCSQASAGKLFIIKRTCVHDERSSFPE